MTPIVWLIGYLARKRGDAPTFKKFVKYFFYMYVFNTILGIINIVATPETESAEPENAQS